MGTRWRAEILRISFRGRELDAGQLDRIRRLVTEGQGRTRQQLAREVCRALRWRRPNGGWAVRSARQLLVRLQEAGVLRLPAPQRAQGRPKRKVLEQEAMLEPGECTPTAVGIAATRSTLVVRPIRPDELPGWRTQMQRYHYLGDGALVGESLRYVAELDGERVALLSWGAASLRNGPRDRYLGWDDATRKAKLDQVVNNARFLILPWGQRPHLASRILGANLRRLGRDWQQVYGHRVVVAETFVDSSRFRGTCYRASNWIAVGETKGWAKSGESYRFHGQRKAVWLYPLVRDFRHLLRSEALSGAPKEEGWMAVDTDKLPLHGQGGLLELLCSITDTRKRRGVRYKIQAILASAICAVLAGAKSFVSIGEWAAEQSRETLLRLGCKRGKPPSERTYRRTFARVDVRQLDDRVGGWMAEQVRLQAGMGLSLDGKTARGSGDGDKRPLQLLSAIVHGTSAVVAQVAVESKTNEIPQVKPLLQGLHIEGMVVTADALHTQTDTACYLVEEKKADYVFTVKDNQPTLRQDIASLGLEAFPPSAHHTG